MKFIVEEVKPGFITLNAPGTNYRNTFKWAGTQMPEVGKKIFGTIYAVARKIEEVSDGGNYVEPLFGLPRRMQGLVLSQDTLKNELLVLVGYQVRVTVPATQNAGDFAVGSRVGWDNAEQPSFMAEASDAITTGA
ncbi:MAG TPA: hypothetical protein VMG59_05740 [Phycisphaerae bacterium]|nr:hypothetical protein [Phycisphaerae bacterium]